ncbi:MAG: hypothetical protein M1813_007538 [Trichoglossum hirsutum]|nr:MAG: hypothetical protein M1813_007538 [Trichoglossum hirsutum]
MQEAAPESRRCFRPAVTRPPVLTGVLVLTLILIALVEYACRILPEAADNKHRAPSALGKRQAGGLSTSISRSSLPTPSPTPSAYVNLVSTVTSVDTTSIARLSLNPQTTTEGTVSIILGTTAYVNLHSTVILVNTASIVRSPPPPPPSTPSLVYVGLNPMTTPEGTTASTSSSAYIEMSTTAPSAYVDLARSSKTIGNASPSAATPAPPVTTTVLHFPLYRYFIGAYLPTIIAVIYRMFWTAIYATIKLVEPFRQLAEPTGALGKDALYVYYLSSNLTPDPILGLLRGHWIILFTSIGHAIAGIIVPFAAETLLVDTKGGCVGGSGPNPCFPRLSVDRLSGRILQGLLCFAAVATLALIFFQRNRRSGVYGDPSNIATMASLLHHPEVLNDFRRLDKEVTDKELKRQLGGKRYRLANYLSSGGVQRYGLVPVLNGLVSPNILPGGILRASPPIRTRAQAKSHFNQHKILVAIRDVSFGLILVGTLGLVVAYYREAGDTRFNRFMNSQAFGPRFIMTLVGGLIDAQWKRIEREVRTVNPYRRLAHGHARPHNTILVRFTSTPLTTFPVSIFRRHFFVAFIALVALFSEVLVVMLAGVPFQAGQTWMAFLVSTYSGVGILGLMIIALIALFQWRRRPELPRIPNTVAATLSYLCASYLREDFERLGHSTEIDVIAKGHGQTYSYGLLKGTDMVTRWAVDKDLDPEDP